MGANEEGRQLGIDLDAYYQQYGPMVLRRCRALLKDPEEAMDAMQDVFVELLRRQDRLTVGSPSSFLYRTATNVCLNRLRTKRRRPQDLDPELLARIACAPEAENRSAVLSMLDRIFQREQPSTRTMAVMHLVDGMTLAEVASEVGLSESGVRKRLRLLRKHVRELEGVM